MCMPPFLAFVDSEGLHSGNHSSIVWWLEKKMAPKGSGTIKRCSFVEVGMALLEVMCHCGG